METQVKLEHKVNFRWLIIFALPTIFSSIFSSLYSTVDGIFVARWVIPVLILPQILGMNGVWMSTMVGEMLSIFMSIYYFRKTKDKKWQ